MKAISTGCLIAWVFASSSFGGEPSEKDGKPGLVVHEWGVLFAGRSGGKTVLGATDKYLESLPEFVIRNDYIATGEFVEKGPSIILKPVIHLYGEEGQKVEVSVSVSQGYPIVYYPRPKPKMHSANVVRGGRLGTLTYAQGMTWNLRLSHRRPGNLAGAPEGHWWNAARDIPSNYVVMDEPGATSERFLFYEGTTFEDPMITAEVGESAVTVSNIASEKSAPVIIILNDNGSLSGKYVPGVTHGKPVRISKEDFENWDEDTLLSRCRDQWEACEMTAEEAAGIVACWKPELLNTQGFLLISALPEGLYNNIFPIEIKPEPTELRRACLVFDFLAGQDGRKHWLPAIGKIGRKAIGNLGDADFKRRLAAKAGLIKWGEVMTPFVNEVASATDATADPQLKMAASILMKTLTESPIFAPPLPQGVQNPGLTRGGWAVPPELLIPEGAAFPVDR